MLIIISFCCILVTWYISTASDLCPVDSFTNSCQPHLEQPYATRMTDWQRSLLFLLISWAGWPCQLHESPQLSPCTIVWKLVFGDIASKNCFSCSTFGHKDKYFLTKCTESFWLPWIGEDQTSFLSNCLSQRPPSWVLLMKSSLYTRHFLSLWYCSN